jgi:hypothetical protein
MFVASPLCNQDRTTTTTTFTTSSTTSTTTSSSTTTTTTCNPFVFTLSNDSSYDNIYWELRDADTGIVVDSGYIQSGTSVERDICCGVTDNLCIYGEYVQPGTMDVEVVYGMNSDIYYGVTEFSTCNIGPTPPYVSTTSTTSTTTTTSSTTSTTTTLPTFECTPGGDFTVYILDAPSTTTTTTSTTTTTTSTTTTTTTSSTTTTTTTVAPITLDYIVVSQGSKTIGITNTAWNVEDVPPPASPIINNYFNPTTSLLVPPNTQTLYSGEFFEGNKIKITVTNTAMYAESVYLYYSNNNGLSFTLLGAYDLPSLATNTSTYSVVKPSPGGNAIIECRVNAY